MKLNNEFTVAAPLERTWATLLEIERVATCLPGARLEPGGEDGVYRGEMKIKLGPMSMAYNGVARISDIDEDARITTIDVQGRDAKGAGTAAAMIQSRLEPEGDGGTRVVVETDLKVTGRPAQFGRGIMEDVAGKMLRDFATRLEAEILSGGGPEATQPEGPAAPGGKRGADEEDPGKAAPTPAEALDLSSAVSGPLVRYGAIGAGALVLLALIARVFRGGGSKREIAFKFRW